jgi:biotin carboxyl carrier protein
MTLYAVSVGDRQYRVEVRDSQLLVDGEPVDFELTSLNGNGLHLFRRGERSTEMYFKSVGEDDFEVHVGGCYVMAQVDLMGGRRRRLAARHARAEVAAGDVVAPMPGLVVDVMVTTGQMVAKGDVLLTQESMKMQMQLRAPFAGVVNAVHVTSGEQVDKGAMLVEVSEA